MTNSLNHRRSYGNETSLVELTATLIRGRRVFYFVFLLVTGLGVAYALLATERYEYVSLVQVAEKSDGEIVETPAATIATLESRWLPEQQAIYRAETEQALPFEVSFSNPSNTNLLRFRTLAARSNADLVREIHVSLIDKMEASQNARIESERKSLERRLTSLDKVIKSLQGQKNTSDAIAGAIESRVTLEGELEQLKGVEILVVSRESTELIRPDRKLIVAIALVFGGLMGIFLVFFAEFWVAVRNQIGENALVDKNTE